MTLSSMVVSRDWQEVSVLECILGSLHMEVAVESAPQRALERLTKSKIDALIVDCDLNGTGQFFRELQKEAPRAATVPLVIMGSPQGKRDMEGTGAMFAFDKPISVEQAVRTLSAARNMILDGRLRYHRAGLEAPVTLLGRHQKRGRGATYQSKPGRTAGSSRKWIRRRRSFACGLRTPRNQVWSEGRSRSGMVRQTGKCWHPLFEHDAGNQKYIAALAGPAVFCELGESSSQFSVLSSQFSVLSSQFSVLSSQFSVLSSQFSVLSSQFLVPGFQNAGSRQNKSSQTAIHKGSL